MANYQDLLKKYLNDGARNTRFDVKLVVPIQIDNNYNDSQALSIMCKTTNFPSRTIQAQNIIFRGRTVAIPVSSKYSNTWTCTFYNDENHLLRKLFEQWIDAVDSKSDYTSFTDDLKGLLGGDIVKDEIKIEQYSNITNDFRTALPTATWTLYGVFPTDITVIELGSETEALEEFTVTFAYTYYTISVNGETE